MDETFIERIRRSRGRHSRPSMARTPAALDLEAARLRATSKLRGGRTPKDGQESFMADLVDKREKLASLQARNRTK